MARSQYEQMTKQVVRMIENYYQDPEAFTDDEIRIMKDAADALGYPFEPRTSGARILKNLGFNLLDTGLLGALPNEWGPEAFTASEKTAQVAGDVLGMAVPGAAAFKFGKWLMPTGGRGAVSNLGRIMSQAERGFGRGAMGRGGAFAGGPAEAGFARGATTARGPISFTGAPAGETVPNAFRAGSFYEQGGLREAAKGVASRAASSAGGNAQKQLVDLLKRVSKIKNPTLRAAYRNILVAAYKGVPYAERGVGMGAGMARRGLGILENYPRATRWGATGAGFLGLHNALESEDWWEPSEYDPFQAEY